MNDELEPVRRELELATRRLERSRRRLVLSTWFCIVAGCLNFAVLTLRLLLQAPA